MAFEPGCWRSGGGWQAGGGEAQGDFVVDGAQGLAELWRGLWLVAGHERAQDAVGQVDDDSQLNQPLPGPGPGGALADGALAGNAGGHRRVGR